MKSRVEMGEGFFRRFFSKIYLILFFQGIYSQLLQAVLLRELIIRFSGMELTLVIALGAAMAWTAAGCALCAFFRNFIEKHFEAFASFFCALSPLLAIASFLFAVLFPPLLGGRPDTPFGANELIFFCILAPLPFGIINGAIYGLLSTASSRENAGGCYAVDALGDMLGGLVFSFLLAGLAKPLAVISIYGMTLPLIGISMLFFKSRVKIPVRIGLCFLALLSLSAVFLCLKFDKKIFQYKWEKILKGFEYEKSIETPYGRVDFLKEAEKTGNTSSVSRKNEERRTVIYIDGKVAATLPQEPELAYPAAVFAAMQPERANLKVLLISSPFSNLLKALSRLTVISKIDFLSLDRELIDTSEKLGIIPRNEKKIDIIRADPRAYLEERSRKDNELYDLIILMDAEPDTLSGNRFFTEEFFNLVSTHLKAYGVFVTCMSSSRGYSGAATNVFNASIIKTLRKVFPKIAITPGENKLIAAGSSNVTAVFTKLDARIGKYMKAFKEFPQGMMSVIFSQSEQMSESQEIEKSAEYAEENRDSRPVLPFYYLRYKAGILSGDIQNPGAITKFIEWCFNKWLFILIWALSLYILVRFILARNIVRYLSFASFENGLYAMGLELLLLFIYQNRCGALYGDLAAAIGIFIGGTALGAWVSREYINLKKTIMIMSFLIPLLLPFIVYTPQLYTRILIFILLFLGASSAGCAYSDFADRSTVKKSAELWAWEMAGGTFGVLFFVFFMLPAAGFIPSLVLLSLLRFPFIFKPGN